MIATKSPKPRPCKVCTSLFTPSIGLLRARVCSPLCGLELARSKRAKVEKAAQVKDKRETRARLEKLKKRGQWLAEAQAAFNAYIRARDYGKLCISSGLPMDWSGNGVDAGHYRSRGSAPHLRFDERNCHAQSKRENRYASGNVVGYRWGLIERIGLEAVEALEADQTPRNYTIEDLKAIKAKYTAMARELRAKHER